MSRVRNASLLAVVVLLLPASLRADDASAPTARPPELQNPPAAARPDRAAVPAQAPVARPMPAATAERYEIDAVHSALEFGIRHIVSRSRGVFGDFDGTLLVNPANFAATTGTVTVRASSIDTNNNKRDDHLRSPDFFDVEKYPTLSYTITKVEPTGDSTARVTGDFTLRGITKPVTFDVTDIAFFEHEKMGKIMGFNATGKIDRTDFGMESSAMLGDEVTLTLNVEAKVPQPEAAGQ